MSLAYDPFKWADSYESEEEYIQELLKDERETNNDNRSNNYGTAGIANSSKRTIK